MTLGPGFGVAVENRSAKRPSTYFPPASNQSSHDARVLFAFEVATLVALCGLAVWSVRPLIEEWGLFRAYQVSGLGYILSIFSRMSMRPLHLVPSATQWILGAGHPLGVGITAALLLAGRYVVARWAVTPLLHPAHRWLFAAIATTLIGWPGLWLARFSPAQFSAIFFFLAVGFSVRVARRPGLAQATGAALSIVAMLMTYQALALAALAIPLLAFVWVPSGQGDLVADRMRRAIRAGLSVAAGLAAYAIYAMVAYKVGGENYETGLLGSLRSPGYSWVLTNLSQAYLTAFFDNKILLACFVFLLAVLVPFDDPQIPLRNAYRTILASLAALLMLPVLAVVYPSILHLRDPERVLFPVTIGFCLVALLACYAAQQRTDIALTMRRCAFVVIGLLCSSAVSAYDVRKKWEFQEDVIFQMQEIIRSTGSNSILIQDHTGQLGDVYSFLESSLADALAIYGTPARVRICTPSGVDRIHPVARRYPILTTKRCEDMEADSDGALVVRATLAGGAIHIGQ